MATKFLTLSSCIRGTGSGDGYSRSLSPRPHYPSMPKYPKGVSKDVERSEARVLFSVTLMTCAGSVEKAVKRLPGIKEAVVATYVNEETIRETIEDVGFEATLIVDDTNEKSIQVCRMLIKGMTCTTCSSTVESALRAVNGVHKAQVALATEEAEVHYDPIIVSHTQLMNTVEDTGFEAILISSGEDISKIHLQIDGLWNDDSIKIIEESLQALPGVEKVDINTNLRKCSVSYKADLTGPRYFIQVIESSGGDQG